MSLIGAGLGFLLTRGAGLRITMAAGCMQMAAGAGGRVRLMDIRSIVQSGRRRMCRSSASEAASDLALAVGAGLAGCPWDRVTFSIRGGDVGAAGGLARSDSATTTAGALLRCMAV